MATKTKNSKNQLSNKGQFVNTAHVDKLITTYKKERWVQNSERLGKNDSLSTWYGLTELEEFLQKAKDFNADGIKIYYGVYPKNQEIALELQGRQTVLLVATKEKVTENGTQNKDIYLKTSSGTNILAFNYGTICPPFCGTGGGIGPLLGLELKVSKDIDSIFQN
jgi:L-cysteine desulfidase